jgi:hypothetical protein
MNGGNHIEQQHSSLSFYALRAKFHHHTHHHDNKKTAAAAMTATELAVI